VTPRLQARIRSDFDAGTTVLVVERLDRLVLPLAEKQSLERIQAAIVLVGAGDLERLEGAARLAETDWRDVLVAARLADGDWPRRLDELLGP
jgi:hypothetical protein